MWYCFPHLVAHHHKTPPNHNASVCLLTAPPLSEVTTSPQPQRTTTTTTTTTVHWGVANTTTTTGLKEGSKGAPKPPPVIPQTTSPPPLESFPLPLRFCEATEQRDITWPQTQRGMLVERPCPKGTRGKQGSLSPPGVCLLLSIWPEASQDNILEFVRFVWYSCTRGSFFLSMKSTSLSRCSGNQWKQLIMVLGFSCVISGRNTISQSVMVVLQRSRLSCFSCSSRGYVHPSLDCVWNHVSSQSSSDTGLIRTAKLLLLCSRNRSKLLKIFSEAKLVTLHVWSLLHPKISV